MKYALNIHLHDRFPRDNACHGYWLILFGVLGELYYNIVLVTQSPHRQFDHVRFV